MSVKEQNFRGYINWCWESIRLLSFIYVNYFWIRSNSISQMLLIVKSMEILKTDHLRRSSVIDIIDREFMLKMERLYSYHYKVFKFIFWFLLARISQEELVGHIYQHFPNGIRGFKESNWDMIKRSLSDMLVEEQE